MPLSAPLAFPLGGAVDLPGVFYGNPRDVPAPLYFRQQDFLDLVDQILPDWYVDPLKSGSNSGYEIIQAYAAIFEQASLSAGLAQVTAYAMYAAGGSSAKGQIQFKRPSAATGNFTVLAGTVVRASKSGRQYVLDADVSFTGGALTVTGNATSQGQAGEYNVPGPLTAGDGTALPGEIDEIVLPLTRPVYADPAMTVSQVATFAGGQAPVLDQIGQDRGIERIAGEGDGPYKRRVQMLPDTVTPAAIRRHLDAAFFALGLKYKLIETWDNSYTGCWDQPLGTTTDPIMGTLSEGELAFDDPREDRFSGRWMDEADHRGAYVLVVPRMPTIGERGMAWNDTATGYATVASGFRATAAWDGPPTDLPAYAVGVWDGVDIGRQDFLQATWDLFKRIKGGGVAVSFVLAGVNQVLV